MLAELLAVERWLIAAGQAILHDIYVNMSYKTLAPYKSSQTSQLINLNSMS